MYDFQLQSQNHFSKSNISLSNITITFALIVQFKCQNILFTNVIKPPLSSRVVDMLSFD